MDSENYYAREAQCVEMADKKTYYFEQIVEYKNTDGSRGWILQVKEKK
mgnify:FL=1